MHIEVVSPGLCTSVQAGPRQGLRHLGIGSAGPMDAHAHAVANLLVGNAVDAPALEITLTGPQLHFHGPARIALAGAPIHAHVDAIPVPAGRPVDLPAGSTLRLGRCRDGARTSLAVAGGLQVHETLGSASTDMRAGFGGPAGRALAAGDHVSIGLPWPGFQPDAVRVSAWWVDSQAERPADTDPVTVRVLPGRDATRPGDALLAQVWQVGADSNRQGLRLAGPALHTACAGMRRSAPVVPGTVQLPPDGQPIILMADAQTHGGYPCIGHVIAADWPHLAQLRPGATLRLQASTYRQAHDAARHQRQALYRLALAIAHRHTPHG